MRPFFYRCLPALAVPIAAFSPSFSHAQGAVELPEVVISAGRRVQPIQEAGSAISVITAQDIADSAATDAVDILRGVPGVIVTESGGLGGLAEVSLRGASARQTLVLIDGVRVNDPSSARNAFDFSAFSAADVERIEVLRGPQSALYGSDAMGGVINIITRKGEGPARGSLTVEGGSFGTATTHGSISAGSDDVSFAFSGSLLSTDGFSRYAGGTEADGTVKLSGSARLGFDLYDWLMIEAGVTGYSQESDIDNVGFTPRDSEDTSRRLIATGFVRAKTTDMSGRWNTMLTLYGNRTNRDFFDENSGTSSYEGLRGGVEAQSSYDFGSFGTFLAGVSAEEESADIREQGFGGGLNLANESQLTLSIFAIHEFQIGERLTLSLGGRVDDFDSAGTFATGRATAAYFIPETDTKFRASIGSGAKAPTVYQKFHPVFGTPTLEVEESIGLDAGVDQSLFDDRLFLSAGVFYNSFTNLIDFDFGTSTYQNISGAKTYGIETSGEVQILPGKLSALGSYTYLETENTDTGDELGRRPNHTGRASLIFTGIPKLRLEGRVTVVGARFNRSRERDRLDGFARVDAFARYQVTPNFAVHGRIENLLDADYEDPKNFGTPGLSAYAGVTASF